VSTSTLIGSNLGCGAKIATENKLRGSKSQLWET